MSAPEAAGAGTALLPRHAADGRPLRVVHLTTVDMSLELLLGTELDVDVATGWETFGASAPGRYVEAVERRGVRHLPIPSLSRSWGLRSDARAVAELVAVLRRVRPDVLHTHNPKTGVLGRIVGRLLGVPVVVNTCHGLWAGPTDPWRKRALVYAAEVVAAAFSHGELFQNPTDRATLRRWIPARKCEVVGNGVDLHRFAPSPGGRARVRAELGVGEHTVLVGGVGRLVAEKGVPEYVAAAAELRERFADAVRLVWVGPEDPAKPDAVATGGTAVEFLGERADMPALYSALDVFVLPSHREGLSRSAMEAAACRTAMVLTDIRGCREIGAHDHELLLVPPRDAVALGEAVGRLVAAPEERERLADGAQARARQAFDQRRVAERSLRTYARVAARRGLGWRAGAPR